VNGKHRQNAAAGSFARIQRKWKSGDRIELELPMKTRLETIDRQHSDTVALVTGPLVLFGIMDSQPPISQVQLLGANKTGPRTWQADTATGPLKLLPWTEIGDQTYTTYLRVT
jgi:DUF1680 family protein